MLFVTFSKETVLLQLHSIQNILRVYIIQLLALTDSPTAHLILPQYQSSYTRMNALSKLDLSSEKQQDQRIVTLQREVENYRIKIANYEQLEKEINSINESINQPRQVSISKNKDPSGKKIMETQSKGGGSARISSNKKIKMYELQKKLKKLTTDLQEKLNAYQRSKLKEANLLSSIEATSRRIEGEKQNAETLINLENKIQKEIDSTCHNIQRQLANLEDSVKSKQLFNFEKRQIRDQLRRLRSLLTQLKSSENREQIELSLSLTQELQNDQDATLKGADEGWMVSLSESERGWADRQKHRIESLMFKIDTYREKNTQILSSFYKQKKQFNDNQIQAKHHKITIQIHSTRLKQYSAMIANSKANISRMSEQSETLSAKVRRCQGVRGDLRGKIGIAIEQYRLVRNVNVLLEEDLQRLQQKCQYMKMLKRRFQRQIR